ncbi:ComEC/Rec2 family competence protein [Mucilaginibacter sp. CSA2-8R]|uniref:ComEC/Rec2 family competence protein n=1 Tax=Mucilaginibacter sp. CSA2-8R TaxID=3141542 RepID=UPI00315D4F4E
MQTLLRAHKGEIPFFYWLLPLIAGIISALHSNQHLWVKTIAAVLGISTLLFVGSNLFYNRLSIHRFAWLGGALLSFILFCAGWLGTYRGNDLNSINHFAKLKADYLIVKIVSEPSAKGIYTRFNARAQSLINGKYTRRASGNLLVTFVADSNTRKAHYGDVWLIPATYKHIDPPYNPAEFNYKQYLANQNIYYQSFLPLPQARLLRRNQGNRLIAFSLQIRQQLIAAIKNYLHNPEAAAIASTLLLGYKADLSSEVLQAYSKTGTIHVLSVSGAHVAVIFWLISTLLKPFRHHRFGKWLNAGLSLVLIWGYAILTGLSPAVCRAAVMLSLIILSKAGSRPVHTLNVLAVSAFGLLLYNPLLITDVGFQLSYLAVFGLLVVQPVIYELKELKNQVTRKLWYACSASVAAQIITFPLSAYYFHQFPVYFLISNLLILIPAEAIVIIGAIFLTSTFIPFLKVFSQWSGYLLEQIITGMTRVLSFIEHLPYASIGKIWLTPFEYWCWYLLIGLTLYFFISKKAAMLKLSFVYVLVLCISSSWKAAQTLQTERIVFFNVKKNTATLFQRGRQAVLVTNFTLADKNYQYSIQPCLDSLGVDSLLFCQPQQSLQTTFFKKQSNYVQFMQKTVLFFNPSLDKTVLNEKLPVDYVLLSQNPHVTLKKLNNSYAYNYLIAEASNSPQRLKKLVSEADSLHINLFNLRRNKSYIVASN